MPGKKNKNSESVLRALTLECGRETESKATEEGKHQGVPEVIRVPVKDGGVGARWGEVEQATPEGAAEPRAGA